MVNKLLVILAQGLFIVACDRREPASDMCGYGYTMGQWC